MRIKIIRVRHHGELGEERVVLKALLKADIGKYILADTDFYSESNSVSTRLRHSFWFPDKIVKPGDFIVLFTKTGSDTQVVNSQE